MHHLQIGNTKMTTTKTMMMMMIHIIRPYFMMEHLLCGWCRRPRPLHTYIHIRLIEVDIRNQTENYALTRRKVIEDEIMLNKVAVSN